MATYPIKMLKDEENKPFVPLVSTDCIRDENNQTLQQILDKKLSPNNLLAGDYVNITTEGNNCYVNVDLPANLNIINNLTTNSAGQGALDAYQGKVLKDSIPQVINDLSSTSTTSALSANQGYVLNNKFNNYLPLTGGTLNGPININISQELDGITVTSPKSPQIKVSNGTYSVRLHVGSGGVNHGVYSDNLDKWMIYATDSQVIVNGHSTSDLSLSGGTLTGNLSINKSTPTLTIKATDTSTQYITMGSSNYSYNLIQSYDNGTSYGANVAIQSGGAIAIGGGESSTNLMTALNPKTLDKEYLFLLSDSDIFLESNCQTIGNRLGFMINSSGELLPIKAETATSSSGSIGNSSCSLKSLYIDTIYLKGRVLSQSNSGGTWIQMSHGSGASLYNGKTNTAASGSNASALWGIKTQNGAWSCGVVSGQDNLYFCYGTDSNYNSGTNTTSTAYISSAGAFTSASSRETKENIESYNGNALDIINNTLICSFNYKADNNKSYRIGFIADDTDSIMSGEKHDSFDINNTVGLLLKAVQELDVKNKKISERIALLEEE